MCRFSALHMDEEACKMAIFTSTTYSSDVQRDVCAVGPDATDLCALKQHLGDTVYMMY